MPSLIIDNKGLTDDYWNWESLEGFFCFFSHDETDLYSREGDPMDGRNFEQPPLMTPNSAARYLGLQRCTLDRWRCTGSPLPFYKIGGRIFYRRADLDAYIEGCKRNSTAEKPRPQAANDVASRTREKKLPAPQLRGTSPRDTQLSFLLEAANDGESATSQRQKA